MKKIFYGIFVFLMLIPTIVFAAEKEAKTMIKIHEDNEKEYYFYGKNSSDIIINADGFEENITVEQALKDGADINELKGVVYEPIYSKVKGSLDLIVEKNVIKYSVRSDDNKLTDYYLYLEEMGNKDTICDKEKTICFDSTTKTLTLEDFKGENLYISEVDINKDEKFDEIKVVVKGNNVISSQGEKVAFNINWNPVIIESDKGESNISSDYSSLTIESQAIGIATSGNLSIKNIQLQIAISLVPNIDGVYGIFGMKSDLSTDNTTLGVSLFPENSSVSDIETYGIAIGLINSKVDIKNNSWIIVSSAVSGLAVDNSDGVKEFNIGEDVNFSIETYGYSDELLEDVAVSLKNVKLTNQGIVGIEDSKNAEYTMELKNSELNNEYVFITYSEAKEAALSALSSKLNINGELFMISNDREEKNDDVNSMILTNTELKISEELIKTPAEFANKGCTDEGTSCIPEMRIYTNNSVRAVIATDKLVDEDLDITLYLPEKVEKFVEMSAVDEKELEGTDGFSAIKGNLGESIMLKYYRVYMSSILEEEVSLPNGNYKIQIPIPGDINIYDSIKIMTVNKGEKKPGKELKYTKGEDGKYFIIELTKEDLGDTIDIIITGDEIKQVSTGQVIIGTSVFVLVIGLGAIVYKTKKKRKMFSI